MVPKGDYSVVGIDPGINGAFFMLTPSGYPEMRCPMPTIGSKIDPFGIWKLMKIFRLRAAELDSKLAFGVEKVFTMPSDKRSSELILELRKEESQIHFNGLLDELEKVLKKADGRVGILNYGIGYGMLLGAIAAIEARIEVFHPSTWQARMHQGIEKTLKPKERSLMAASRLFKRDYLFYEDGRHKTPPDGLVDASLIAEYTRLLLGGPEDVARAV